jgi:hypothetical protein
MAFYTQQVNSFEAIQQAVLAALASEGWTVSGSVVSKGGICAKITINANYLRLYCGTGISGGEITGGPKMVTGQPGTKLDVCIGRVLRSGSWSPFAFPAKLLLFIFDSEVYIVLNNNVEEYQYLAFGKSGVPGIPGTGNWFAGTFQYAAIGNGNGGNSFNMTEMVGGAYYQNNKSACGIFWNNDVANSLPYNGYNSWFHHGFLDVTLHGDTTAWMYSLAQAPLAPLYATQPNAWNSESILLPLRAYAQRPEATISLVGELQNARLVRIDYLTPEQIITLGQDKWMALPWFKKDTANRNGSTLTSNATGTLGWAVRYEG